MLYSYYILYSPGGALSPFPRVYRYNIIYIPALILFFIFSPVDHVLLYYPPRRLAFSLSPGVFAVDAPGICGGSLLQVLPGVVPFGRSGICRGLPWRLRTVGAVAVFRQRVQKYTFPKKRLIPCTLLCGAFFLFSV